MLIAYKGQMAKRPSIWRRSIWRTEVGTRVDEMTNRLDAVEQHDRAGASMTTVDEPRKAAKAVVKASLDKAQEALDKKQSFWDGLMSWWTGETRWARATAASAAMTSSLASAARAWSNSAATCRSSSR